VNTEINFLVLKDRKFIDQLIDHQLLKGTLSMKLEQYLFDLKLLCETFSMYNFQFETYKIRCFCVP
jgi:hypothetical protein